jgi:RHS repeat-associated protein
MGVTSYYSFGGEILGEATGGVRRDYLTDALGSVTGTVTGSGVIENTYRYKPYGSMLSKTGSANDPKYLWTGSSGSRADMCLYAEQYNRARCYSYTISRWISIDSLWPNEPAYTYVLNCPTLFRDPTGNKACQDGDCCNDVSKWYSDHINFCNDGKSIGTWVDCPTVADVTSECNKISKKKDSNSIECRQILRIIQGIGNLCQKMCSGNNGGGYSDGSTWDAATHCCVQANGKSKGCSTKCCSLSVKSWKSNPVLACRMKCLLFHESLHLQECSKNKPIDDGTGNLTPPYNECCAYANQIDCLMKIAIDVCGNVHIPPNVTQCRNKVEECRSRYWLIF